MKRLCVFYRLARKWEGKPIEWIVCKECQRKLRKGPLAPLLQKALDEGALICGGCGACLDCLRIERAYHSQ